MAVVVESVKDLFTHFHPNALKFVRPTAQYVTATRREMIIYRAESGLWKVRFYRGTELPEKLKGRYLTFKSCEQDLIAYLQSKDKWNRALWPGKYDKSNSK
jgi:hypothetical protein